MKLDVAVDVCGVEAITMSVHAMSGLWGSHFVQDGGCSHVVDVHEDSRIDRATGLLG